MKKNNASCLWGDCPNLDHGPMSTEHESRFAKPHKAESKMITSDSTMMINGDNTPNQAK